MGLERDLQSVKQSVNSSNEPADQDRSESTPLYGNVVDTGTLKLIIAFFFGFSITVTVALAIQISYDNPQIPLHGTVVSDNEKCSNLGAEILKQGGNAIDATIAVAFCMGVMKPQMTGLGSGGFMLIYNQQERKLLDSIDFRATKYRDDISAGVPGFVAGMALAHKLYGSMPWKNLLTPAEQIARESLKAQLPVYLSKIPRNPSLAKTLSALASSDPHEFYRNKSFLASDLGRDDDLTKITEYKAIRGPSTMGSFMHYNIIVPGKGSGGPLLLENLKSVNLSLSPLVSAIDAYKATALNWPAFAGTHIAVMDINDIYVSLVSGLGTVSRTQTVMKSGYVMNNIMSATRDHVSERPDTLLTPVIVLENDKICGRRLLFGGGDVRDVAQVLIYLLRHPPSDTTYSIEAPRVRIQTPTIGLEHGGIPDEDFDTLHKMDFNLTNNNTSPQAYPSINVIQKINDTVTAHADSRGAGNYATF